MTEYEGEYHIKLVADPRAWWQVPNSTRVFVDGGAVTFYNGQDDVVYCVGNGVWLELASTETMAQIFPDFEEEDR